MKVMISQPMRDKTEEQIREERKPIIDGFKKLGDEVIDTIFIEESPKDMDTAIYFLAKSIESIGKVDAVYFMRDWEKARGCKIEHQVAVEYGKKILYENQKRGIKYVK